MAKKKPLSVVGMIGEAVSDVVDAASVAATGSQLGVLELAAEEEMRPAASTRTATAARRTSKAKAVPKKPKAKKPKTKEAKARKAKSKKSKSKKSKTKARTATRRKTKKRRGATR